MWESIPERLRALGPEEVGKRLEGFDWSHIRPHSQGGSNEASNGIFELASLNRINGRRKVTYSRQPSVRSSPASDLFLEIDGEEDAGCGRCGKPRSSRFSKLPVGALFASMGSVGVHGPGVGRQRCVRVA